MSKWIGTTCAIAVLMAGTASAQSSSTRDATQQKSTSATSQAARNRTERVTVNGCLIRGSEYAEVPNLGGYVLRDVQTVAPNTTASNSTGATYGTETTGNATASASVSGNDAGVEASKGNIAQNNEQKDAGVGVPPSTDAQGSTPGAGATAQARGGTETDTTRGTSGTASPATVGTTGSTDVTAYTLEGVSNPTTYIGKRVEITGMMMAAPSTQSANANHMSRLRVTSVKVIPGSCSK